MAAKSLFDKHNNYSQKIILISIKTMSPEEKILLQKGYGVDYIGNGYLYRNEQFSFDMADRKLEKRLKEVDELIKQGKSEEEIMSIYSKQKVQGSIASYFTRNIPSVNNNSTIEKVANTKQNIVQPKPTASIQKIAKPLEEYFPKTLRKDVMEYIATNISQEEKELLNYFFTGSNYEICKNFIDDLEKRNQLSIFINRVNSEVIRNSNIKIKTQVQNKKGNTTIDITDNENHILNKIDGEQQKKKKRIKTGGKVAQGYLTFFDEKNHDKVLEIIETFKETKPNYYAAIIKRYSGKNYEIVQDVKLTPQEISCIKTSRDKIKGLLINPHKKSRNIGQGYLYSFKKEDYDQILEIIEKFKTSNPNYYEVINKKYSGEHYEIVNNVELTDKEKKTIKDSKARIRDILSNPDKKRKYRNEGYLSSFEEKDYDKILEIIESFKEINPNYYEVINKKYSGEYYEISNSIELSDKEKSYIRDSKTKIRYLLSRHDIKSKNQGFLTLFEKEDHEKVLEIIELFKQTNFNYYKVIAKKYSGQCYEIINDVQLSKAEREELKSARRRIRNLLKNNMKPKKLFSNKVTTSFENIDKTIEQKNTIYINSINDILKFVPIKSSTDLIFNYIINNKNNIFRTMTIQEIIDCYVENLDFFSDIDATLIIKIISIYEPSMISKLIKCSYFKNKLQSLTVKEQEYIYLTLLSYSKPYLTEEKISEILEIDREYLNEYQIMTNNEDVNKLNILFNKSE